MKRIAVLIPVYNCEQFVAESVQSILDQTYREFTVFIVDDCSSDQTINVVKTLDDPRIRVIAREQNSGIVDTLNRGLDEVGAEFDYIARMDGDDISLPERFAKQVQFLEDHPEVGVVSCYYELFEQQQGIAKAET